MTELNKIIDKHLITLLNAIDAADNHRLFEDGTLILKNPRRDSSRGILLALVYRLKSMDDAGANAVAEAFNDLYHN